VLLLSRLWGSFKPRSDPEREPKKTEEFR